MLSAAEAKKMSKEAEYGLKPFMDNIFKLIEEAAKRGETRLEIIFPETVDEKMLDRGLKSLYKAGYIARMIEVRTRCYNEDSGRFDDVPERGFLISWGWAK